MQYKKVNDIYLLILNSLLGGGTVQFETDEECTDFVHLVDIKCLQQTLRILLIVSLTFSSFHSVEATFHLVKQFNVNTAKLFSFLGVFSTNTQI